MAILSKVMRYLEATGMPRSVFGRRAVNDPRLVYDMWNGREPTSPTLRRIETFIAAHPEQYVRPARRTRRRNSNAR